MRETIYKNTDLESSPIVSESSTRVVRTVPAPFLLERIFFDHKTGEKIHSDTLNLVVDRGGNLKSTLKDAFRLLLKSDNIDMQFEFDGMKFSIYREDRYEDVYSMISEAVEGKRIAERKLSEKRNSNNTMV